MKNKLARKDKLNDLQKEFLETLNCNYYVRGGKRYEV